MKTKTIKKEKKQLKLEKIMSSQMLEERIAPFGFFHTEGGHGHHWHK